MHILILGGTAEAMALSDILADRPDVDATLSLAGRTASPRTASVKTRIGGFGGVEGLRDWLVRNAVQCVVDATHPFAARISRNAVRACSEAGIRLFALRRPAWERHADDHWIDVQDMDEAVTAIGENPRRVFLTIGRQEVGAFASATQHHYVVRSIEPIGDVLPSANVTALQARGPFNEQDEIALMRQHGIDILVTKNSGGAATYGKVAAARRMAIPVVMVARPASPDVPWTGSVAEAAAWIDAHDPPP